MIQAIIPIELLCNQQISPMKCNTIGCVSILLQLTGCFLPLFFTVYTCKCNRSFDLLFLVLGKYDKNLPTKWWCKNGRFSSHGIESVKNHQQNKSYWSQEIPQCHRDTMERSTNTNLRPSKLVTCLNDDGCFEGVPSPQFWLVFKLGVSLPDTGMLLQSKHEHSKGGVSLLKGSHRYAQFWPLFDIIITHERFESTRVLKVAQMIISPLQVTSSILIWVYKPFYNWKNLRIEVGLQPGSWIKTDYPLVN